MIIIGGLLVSPGPSFAATPPAITSSATATATAGSPFSFTVTTSGTQVPSIKEKGRLPKGVNLTNNHNGTATLAGTASPTTGGVYPRPIGGVYDITMVATFGAGDTKQIVTEPFTLIVDQAPTITSRGTKNTKIGVFFTFTVKTRGYPKATISRSGSLPSDVTFKNNGNGSASLAGRPGPGSAGTYPITLSASNGVGARANQPFTLVVKN